MISKKPTLAREPSARTLRRSLRASQSSPKLTAAGSSSPKFGNANSSSSKFGNSNASSSKLGGASPKSSRASRSYRGSPTLTEPLLDAPPPERMSLHFYFTLLSSFLQRRWGEVRWGEVRWGEVRWGEVRWGEVRKVREVRYFFLIFCPIIFSP